MQSVLWGRFLTHLGSVTDAMSFPDLQKRLDGFLQVCIHEVVIEDAWGATLGQLVGMSLCQMGPGERPVIQSGACRHTSMSSMASAQYS